MSVNPIDLLIVDASAVAKNSVRSFLKVRVRQRCADASEVNTTDFSGQFGGLFVTTLNANFNLDTSDTTTADNGATCLIDLAGNRFKLVTSSDPAVSRAALYAAPFDALAFNGMQVNGNVDVSQELVTGGATLASTTSKYIADMIEAQYVHGAGTAVLTSAQLPAASFPVALPGYSFGHQLKATTALSSPANGDYALHRWRIEGYRVARLAWGTASAQPLAYAFQFYSVVAGVAFVRFANSAKDRNYYKEFTVAAGWNFFSGTIAGDTSGTWDATTGTGLIVEVYSAGKAASPVAPGAWTATSTTQTTNSTNLLGTSNNLTIMTGLLVLPGIELPSSTRAALIMRPFDEEKDRCKRYYQKSFPYATAVAQNATDTGANRFTVMTAGAVVHKSPSLRFTKEFRSTPTMVFYNPYAANALASDLTAGADCSTTTAPATSAEQFVVNMTQPAGAAVNDSIFVHWTGNARL